MRRRGYQSYARRRVARLGDDRVYLVARQFAAFARLRALRHLDLKLIGVDQIVRGHAEAAGCDLLDGAAPKIAVGVAPVALFALAAFTRVALPADAVHRNGEGFVRLAADGAEAHGA